MDDDDDFVDDAMVQAIGNTLRAVGEFMNCGKCDVQFTVVRQSSRSALSSRRVSYSRKS